MGQGGPVNITKDKVWAPWNLSPTYPTWFARGKGLEVLCPQVRDEGRLSVPHSSTFCPFWSGHARGQRAEVRGQWKGAPSGRWGLGEEGLKALFISSLEKHTGF